MVSPRSVLVLGHNLPGHTANVTSARVDCWRRVLLPQDCEQKRQSTSGRGRKAPVLADFTRLSRIPKSIASKKRKKLDDGEKSSSTPSTCDIPQSTLSSASAEPLQKEHNIGSFATPVTRSSSTPVKHKPLFGSLIDHIASILQPPPITAPENDLLHFTVPITNRKHTYPISPATAKANIDWLFQTTQQKYANALLPPTHFRYKQMMQIIKRLWNATPFIPTDLQLYLLDRGRIPTIESSGFTTGGNKVFIMTSMFDKAVSDPQVAFILCHELGHCLAQHAAEREALCAANGIHHDSEEHYWICREQEYEADHIGLEISRLGGYPWNAGIAWLERAKAANSYLPRGQAFSRHPTCGERIVALKAGGRRAQL